MVQTLDCSLYGVPVFAFCMWILCLDITPDKQIIHCNIYLIRNVPRRARVRLARRRNEDEDSANKLYTLVTVVKVDSFKSKNLTYLKEYFPVYSSTSLKSRPGHEYFGRCVLTTHVNIIYMRYHLHYFTCALRMSIGKRHA